MSNSKRVKPRKKNKTVTPREKREMAIITPQDDGGIKVECPFCAEPHPIRVGIPAHCGTALELTAVNTTHRGHSLICAICGEQGGTMLKSGNSYHHNYNCKPGVTIYPGRQPKLSWTAKIFYNNAPDGLIVWWANTFNRTAQELRPLNEDSEIQEEVVGYAWRQVDAAKRTI